MGTSLQVAGLASGFDWKTFLDQIMEIERAPVQRIAAERAANSQKVGLLDTLGTRLTALKDAANALRSSGVFSQRTVSSTTAGSSWKLAAGSETPLGTYQVAVTQLARPAALPGRPGIAHPLAEEPVDLANLTLATLPLRTGVSAGTFSINGHRITVALTDSLQEAFNAITAATGGDVTASYDSSTDRVTLTSGSGSLMLGAANDTSNFLGAFRLGNSGTASATSAAALGSVKLNAPLASGNFAADLAADAEGNGTFTINGVNLAYNVNTDSLAAVLRRINESGAGVNATYDATADRVLLTNQVTGDLGITATDTTGGLLSALGLADGPGLVRGRDAEFSINGGETLRSASNTLTAAVHGISGLSVTADTEAVQSITVGGDTGAMRARIDTFIARFNEVQQFIDAQTQISSDGKGKMTLAPLAANREIQDWARSLRSLAFTGISGLTGSVARLNDLGFDFKRGSNELELADTAKLSGMLADSNSAVAEFFGKAEVGFSARLEEFVSRISTQNKDQQARINVSSNGLAEQISAIERRLDQQRQLMEAAFLQMERAQATIKQQQSALDGMFASK